MQPIAAEGLKRLDAPDTRLYPGITADQSAVGHEALVAFYNGDIRESERLFARMNRTELRHKLPPLSRLLQVATSVMQLQRNDAENRKERDRLQNLISSTARSGLAACEKADETRRSYPTYLLIQGGIQGLMATLQIKSSPAKAFSAGLNALNSLDKALELDSSLMDAYMGLGIFNCTVARAPLVLRAALSVMGRSASMMEGLGALRRAAYFGQYTSVASLLYLIQFLSPYDDQMRNEKLQIFESMTETFPQSPYYTFLREDEALCFYPDSFFNVEERNNLERRIPAFTKRDYASRRYLTLVQYQYGLLNENPAPPFVPDHSLDLREYRFYPVFIEALRLNRELALESAETSKAMQQGRIETLRDSSLRLLKRSGMHLYNLRLYEWHVRDALRSKIHRD